MTSALLDLATTVAVEAGAVLLERRGNAGAIAYKSSDTDPVSEADKASEVLITQALMDARPDDGLLGEEGAAAAGTSGLRWVIDPLDGTVNFLYGLPAWCVSIACEDEHGAVAGVVHQPTTGLTYSAMRGGGAFCNGRQLSVNDPVELGHALVATGFAYDVATRSQQAQTVAALLSKVRDVRRIGSAALDLCFVAAGLVDGYFEESTKHWDWAAGALIATEAGAITQAFGDGMIAAGPNLYPQLAAAIGVQERA